MSPSMTPQWTWMTVDNVNAMILAQQPSTYHAANMAEP